MKKINKAQARKVYESGETLIVCPCKCSPLSMFAIRVTNRELGSFDRFLNSFEYYNCSYNELGRYAHYYIVEQ